MSEIFEHSTLIEHLFTERQSKQARIEKKTTTLEQLKVLIQMRHKLDILENHQILFLKIILQNFGFTLRFTLKKIQEFFCKCNNHGLSIKKQFQSQFQTKKRISSKVDLNACWNGKTITIISVDQEFFIHLYLVNRINNYILKRRISQNKQ